MRHAARPVFAAFVALVALAACHGPPSTVENRCATDWPDEAAPVPFAAPLADVTPGLLFRARVTGGTPNDWILLTERSVAFTAGGRLFLRSRDDGRDLGGRSSAAFERVSSAVADAAGNFYFVGQSAYSVDAEGNWRWIRPLAGKASSGIEYARSPPAAGRTAALAPDGTLYVGASDGALYAIDTATGAQKWRREVAVGAMGDRGPVVLGGIGGALLAVTRADETRASLFDARTGVPLQRWASAAGTRHGVFFAPSLGIVTQRLADHAGPYPWMDLAVLDRCGAPRWELAATRPQWPVLITQGDRLLVVERDDVSGSPTFVSRYAPDGTRELGPVAAAPPWAIGADGTVYGLQCDAPGHDGPSRLIAYDATMTEKWRLELGASCPSAGPVIDAQGRLYFTWFIDEVTELVAVQTTSPGLANTAWPTRRRDVRGTAWVD